MSPQIGMLLKCGWKMMTAFQIEPEGQCRHCIGNALKSSVSNRRLKLGLEFLPGAAGVLARAASCALSVSRRELPQGVVGWQQGGIRTL